MADQIFNVNCGFFDAVNNDRLYSADQMNRPYKRIITNGVFATPQGTPSTDLQVSSASNGMNIVVAAGEGLFGDKWFENPSQIVITVPNNTGVVPRVDSVIVQVDKRTSGRTGNIVYRTGTPASSPAVPPINTITNVIEYRVANIYVAAGANAINNDAITDLRGSSLCPWVTSLIQQVDTSTLFQQYQTAYENFYDEATTDYENYKSEQQENWNEFVSSLTDDLQVETNMIMLSSNYVATTSVSTVPINIPSYDPDTDILQVYINGLRVTAGVQYTVNSAGTQITLKSAVTSGQTVNFVVFKSVISADIQSTVQMIQKLDDKVANFMADGGWINFTLESGATAYDSTIKPAVRCIGNRIYLRGAIKGLTATGSTICTLPVAYKPAIDHVYTTAAIDASGNVNDTITIRILASTGQVKLYAKSGTIASGNMISIATSFLANIGISAATVYEYMGAVSTYANLPTSGMNTGDVYVVNTADPTHNISAGDEVVWNGSEWEPFTQVVSSAEIDTIIDTIS